MYSGTTLRRSSGRLMGTHQKIDRIARRKIQNYIPRNVHFPASREILRFEGLNGPDGIKKKSPSKDEPWHYIDPTDPNDRQILDLIAAHEKNLTEALAADNNERAAFEAAWLAHAITDGLTPAHHYPYREERDALLGDTADDEATVLKKILTSGDNWREKLKNNYEFFKPSGRGVGSAHLYFELGVASATAPLRFAEIRLDAADRKLARSGGIIPLYLDFVNRVFALNMYDEFLAKGWTQKLARETSGELLPEILRAVMISWYYAAWRAGEMKRASNKTAVKKSASGYSVARKTARKSKKTLRKNG